MATRTFEVAGNFNNSACWDGGVTTPSVGDTLIINAACTHTADDATVYGPCTVNAAWVPGIYDFWCGDLTINAAWTQGKCPAGKGVHCLKFIMAASLTWTKDQTTNGTDASRVYCDGDTFTIPSTTTMNSRGEVYFGYAGTTTLSAPVGYGQGWRRCYVSSATTMQSSVSNPYMSNDTVNCSQAGMFIDGLIDMTGTASWSFQVPLTGQCILGASHDIKTAAGASFLPLVPVAATYTNGKTTAYTNFLGLWGHNNYSNILGRGLAVNIPSGQWRIFSGNYQSRTMRPDAGTIICASLTITNGTARNNATGWTRSGTTVTATISSTDCVAGESLVVNDTTDAGFPNGTYVIQTIVGNVFTFTVADAGGTSGTARFSGWRLTIDNATNNPTFIIGGAVTRTISGSYSGTITYLKGTGTIELDGLSGTANNLIDFGPNTDTEEIIFSQWSGRTKQIVNNFSPIKISGSGAGQITSSVAGTQRTITLKEKSTLTGTQGISVISFGGKNMAGGKSCRNLGNVKGFVFMDMSLSKVAM